MFVCARALLRLRDLALENLRTKKKKRKPFSKAYIQWSRCVRFGTGVDWFCFLFLFYHCYDEPKTKSVCSVVNRNYNHNLSLWFVCVVRARARLLSLTIFQLSSWWFSCFWASFSLSVCYYFIIYLPSSVVMIWNDAWPVFSNVKSPHRNCSTTYL